MIDLISDQAGKSEDYYVLNECRICNGKNLEEYLERFEITLSVLQEPTALKRAAFELAEDCWNDGVRYLELRYSPILHTEKGMTPSESIDAVKKGLEQAEEDFAPRVERELRGAGSLKNSCQVRSPRF